MGGMWFSRRCAGAHCYSSAMLVAVHHNAHSCPQARSREALLQKFHAISPNGFAVVASQADVDWETSLVSSGDVLPQGVHRIRSGVIHLELFSGVQLGGRRGSRICY